MVSPGRGSEPRGGFDRKSGTDRPGFNDRAGRDDRRGGTAVPRPRSEWDRGTQQQHTSKDGESR